MQKKEQSISENEDGKDTIDCMCHVEFPLNGEFEYRKIDCAEKMIVRSSSVYVINLHQVVRLSLITCVVLLNFVKTHFLQINGFK